MIVIIKPGHTGMELVAECFDDTLLLRKMWINSIDCVAIGYWSSGIALSIAPRKDMLSVLLVCPQCKGSTFQCETCHGKGEVLDV